jgi:F-box-like
MDVLPDEILLEIFELKTRSEYELYGPKAAIEEWQPLVHVCRRWRNIVFGSPCRLNLRLYCTPGTPARDTLDIWPALPLIVDSFTPFSSGTDNIIAALGQSNRVSQVRLRALADSQLEEVLAVMQVSFPELTDLQLGSYGETPPVIPDLFLDGSAQCLQTFLLDHIPFPGLPKLHLSATHLFQLWLVNIPHSGYISPEAMVALLSVLSSLTVLCLEFQSPQSRPDWETRHLPPPKRSILPALDNFFFKGVTEYLEDLVTFIDTPRLIHMNMNFFNQIDFDCPRLAQFINRTPKLRAPDEAHVQFNDSFASVARRYRTSRDPYLEGLGINISCREPDWQLSSIEQVCNSSLHPISPVEDLYVEHKYSELVWKDDAIEDTIWLQLLLPFTAVKNLYLSKEFVPGIAAALQELGEERMTEVLPSLQNIFVEALEASRPYVGQFVAARQLSNHPIAIFDWEQEQEQDDWDVKSM